MGPPVYLIWIALSWGNIWRLDICTPILQKELTCKRELSNRHDKYAIKVVKEGETVGHTPQLFLKTFIRILLSGGSMKVRVTEK